jgi:hypothetical protein
LETVKSILKALAVMSLAALGSGSLTAAIGYQLNEGNRTTDVSIGVFLVLGAFFLYRAWFTR